MNQRAFGNVALHFFFTWGAVAFLAAAAAAIAQTSAASPDPSGMPNAPAAVGMPMAKDTMSSATPAMGASGNMHDSMTDMMKNMEAMKTSGDTDRDFAAMMKVHHQGAIDMAQMELQNGKDAKMRAMAKRIIEAQQKEIKEFDQWLAKRK